MKNYLVTGGAGFIGSHLVEELLNNDHRVRVLDNLFSGKKENVAFFSQNKNYEFIQGDIRDAATLKKATEGIDVVFHQAALGSVPRSVEDPITTHEVNITGTLQLLNACKNAGVKRVVNAASSSAYGETPELPKHERMIPAPLSPYAVTKLTQELYSQAFYASYGLETISLRYFNVYGPRQDANSQYAAVIPKFFGAWIQGKSPQIYGDGEQTRDFTFVKDVVRANILASEVKSSGESINIAGARRISINELAKIIQNLLNTSVPVSYLSPRKGDIRDSLADITKAKKILNWQPTTHLEEGLLQCLNWYQECRK